MAPSGIKSDLAFSPMPGFACYGSTKAFLDYWSISASKEYENFGIDFMITHPGAMASEMTHMEENFLLGVSSTEK